MNQHDDMTDLRNMLDAAQKVVNVYPKQSRKGCFKIDLQILSCT